MAKKVGRTGSTKKKTPKVTSFSMLESEVSQRDISKENYIWFSGDRMKSIISKRIEDTESGFIQSILGIIGSARGSCFWFDKESVKYLIRNSKPEEEPT